MIVSRFSELFMFSLVTYCSPGCGAVPDFDTPEYATFGSIQTRDWESSEGMDPFSYGLNTATTSDEYLNGTGIVQTLVDIVSKNGNLWVFSMEANRCKLKLYQPPRHRTYS